MNIRSVRPFAAALLAGVLLVSCAGEESGRRNAEIPLHWEIGLIDSVGGIPADQFVYMPSDRVRPGPPVESVPGGVFVATIDTAIARGVVFRQTALLIATRYSRSQQIEFGEIVAKAMLQPLVLDSLRARRDSLLGCLDGTLPILGRDRRPIHVRVIGTGEVRRLASLPISAFYELEDVAEGEPVIRVAPRILTRDLNDLLRYGGGDGIIAQREWEQVGAALADTTMPLSSRLEFARRMVRFQSQSFEGLRSPVSVDSVQSRMAVLLQPVFEECRARRPLPSRYHDLDDLDSPGNLAR